MSDVIVFVDNEKRKIPDFLIASFDIEMNQLLGILNEAEMSLEDFMDDKKSCRLYLSRDFPLITEDLGWAWLTQIYLPVQKNNNTPCPRSRVWAIQEKMQRGSDAV